MSNTESASARSFGPTKTEMEIMDLLAEPFAPEEIEWRIQSCGITSGSVWALAVPYVSNRAIMNRLDEVFGISNWRNEYENDPRGGKLCRLSVRIGGEWITKVDGASDTDIEPIKGGCSDSMKRAAVQFGIGRHLYYVESELAQISMTRQPGWHRGRTKDGVEFHWAPPPLPEWAVRGRRPPTATGDTPSDSAARPPQHPPPEPPRTRPVQASNREVRALVSEARRINFRLYDELREMGLSSPYSLTPGQIADIKARMPNAA